jgi:hypothetical protein
LGLWWLEGDFATGDERRKCRISCPLLYAFGIGALRVRSVGLFLVSLFVGLVGLAIWLAGFGGLIAAEHGFGNEFVTWDTRAGVALVALASVLFGRQVLIQSRKIRAAAAVKFGWKDSRKPVVYLRSFADDASGEVTWLVKYRFFPVRVPAVFPPLHTEDEQLADVFRAVGPLVAIAQPGLRLQRLGGERIPGGSEWKIRVLSLMRDASLIIIRVNHGDNLWWEFQHAIECIPLSRLILIINQRQRVALQTTIEAPFDDEYELLRRRCERELPLRLPQIPSRETGLKYSNLWGFIEFDSDGEPKVHDFSKLIEHRYRWVLLGWWRWWKPLVRPLRSAFSLYLNRFAIDAEPRPWVRRAARFLNGVGIICVALAGAVYVQKALSENAAFLPTFIPEPKWQVASRQMLIEFGPRQQLERDLGLAPLDLRTRALAALTSDKDSFRPRAEDWLQIYTRVISAADQKTCSILTDSNSDIRALFEAAYRLDASEFSRLVSLSRELMSSAPASGYERPAVVDPRYWQSFYARLPNPAEGEKFRVIYIRQTEGNASGEERCEFMNAALEFYWWLPPSNRPHWTNALWGFLYH